MVSRFRRSTPPADGGQPYSETPTTQIQCDDSLNAIYTQECGLVVSRLRRSTPPTDGKHPHKNAMRQLFELPQRL